MTDGRLVRLILGELVVDEVRVCLCFACLMPRKTKQTHPPLLDHSIFIFLAPTSSRCPSVRAVPIFITWLRSNHENDSVVTAFNLSSHLTRDTPIPLSLDSILSITSERSLSWSQTETRSVCAYSEKKNG